MRVLSRNKSILVHHPASRPCHHQKERICCPIFTLYLFYCLANQTGLALLPGIFLHPRCWRTTRVLFPQRIATSHTTAGLKIAPHASLLFLPHVCLCVCLCDCVHSCRCCCIHRRCRCRRRVWTLGNGVAFPVVFVVIVTLTDSLLTTYLGERGVVCAS